MFGICRRYKRQLDEGWHILSKSDRVFRTTNFDAVLCSKCGRVLANKALTNPCDECLSDPVRMEFEALKDEIQSL